MKGMAGKKIALGLVFSIFFFCLHLNTETVQALSVASRNDDMLGSQAQESQNVKSFLMAELLRIMGPDTVNLSPDELRARIASGIIRAQGLPGLQIFIHSMRNYGDLCVLRSDVQGQDGLSVRSYYGVFTLPAASIASFNLDIYTESDYLALENRGVFGNVRSVASLLPESDTERQDREEGVKMNRQAFDVKMACYNSANEALETLQFNARSAAEDINIQKELDLKNLINFSRESLWMDAEISFPDTPRDLDGQYVCDLTTKRIWVFNNADKPDISDEELIRRLVILTPLKLTKSERERRDSLVEKMRFSKLASEREAALREVMSMVELGLLPRPVWTDDVFQHCHSPHSHSPGNSTAYIVWKAYVLGLKVTGLVDHDTVKGCAEFNKCADIAGLRNPTNGYEQRAIAKGTPFEFMQTNSPGNLGETYVAFHGVHIYQNELQEKRVVPAKIERFKKNVGVINSFNAIPAQLDYDEHIAPLTESGNPTEKHVAEGIARLILDVFEADVARGEYNNVVACANNLIQKCSEWIGETRDLTIKDDEIDLVRDVTKFTFLMRNRIVTPLKKKIQPNGDEVISDRELYEYAHNRGELVYYCYLGLGKCDAEKRDILTSDEKHQFISNMKGSLDREIIDWWLAKDDATMLHLWLKYQKSIGVDGIALMPNRNTIDEVVDVMRIARECGIYHIANGMDVNTEDMPFTYFEYSNIGGFVDESLYISEHERRFADAARLQSLMEVADKHGFEIPLNLREAYNSNNVHEAGHVVGVPKEIKPQAQRVGLTPAGVSYLTTLGVKVLVESGAGREHFSDKDYESAGAEIVDNPEDLWARSTIIKKVKEPLPEEYKYLRKGLIVFTYLHLASYELIELGLADEMLNKGVTGVAYETIEIMEDGKRVTPVLRPMSIIAGDLGGYYAVPYILESKIHVNDAGTSEIIVTPEHEAMMEKIRSEYESGQSVSGWENKLAGKEAVVAGGGVSGERMARRLLESGAKVTIADISAERLSQLRESLAEFKDSLTLIRANRDINDIPDDLLSLYKSADILGGCILVPGGIAPKMSRERLMEVSSPATGGKPKLIIDIALDQGGNFHGSYSRKYDDPVFVDEFGNKRFCVPNMPDAVGGIASIELEKTNIAYLSALALNRDPLKANEIFPELEGGFNTFAGEVKHDKVAEALIEFNDIRPSSINREGARGGVDSDITDITGAAFYAGRRDVPTHESSRYTIMVPFEFFLDGSEYDRHKNGIYADYFNLERVGGSSAAEYVDNVILRAGSEPMRAVVLIPEDVGSPQFTEDLLSRLTSAGIRFVKVDKNSLVENRNGGYRSDFQADAYAIMLLLRRIDKNFSGDSSLYKTLEFYLKSHFMLPEGLTPAAFIDAVVSQGVGHVRSLIGAYLLYRPSSPYDASSAYKSVREALFSA